MIMSTERNVTIQRAREILGDKGKNLSDKQIEIILRSLYALSERIVHTVTQTI